MIKMLLSSRYSIIFSASNNIVRINQRSKGALTKVTNDYTLFSNFLESKVKEFNKRPLPELNEIRNLSNINLKNSFGTIGGLVDSITNDSFDADILLDRKKAKYSPNRIEAKQATRFGGFKIGGVKALGVANSLFSALDFATGLQEGESIGKAASGAAGSLAGSLLGGAIGQALIPVPGLGFIVGSSVGGFLGGFTADRAYDGISEAKRKQEEKLRKTEKTSEKIQSLDTTEKLNPLVNKFEIPVNKFDTFVRDVLEGKINFGIGLMYEGTPERSADANAEPYDGEVSGETFFPLPGGDIGTRGNVSSDQAFGAPREGGKRSHMGLDMTHHTGALDAAVVAYKTGKVTEAVNKGYMGSVEIDHGGGEYTRYVHVTPMVNVGQLVYGGQQIAKLFPNGGNTHLHFEYYKNKTQAVDPVPILRAVKNRLSSPLSVERARQLHESSAASQAGPNVFNLELHHPGARETQRSGLIENTLISGNEVTSSFKSEFGSYPRNFRGGDLGGPRRGLNLLEMANELGVENNAQRIIEIIKKHPNYQFNLFAGHTDVPYAPGQETGAPGEQQFVTAVANRVMQLARAANLRNVKYYPATARVSGDDPRSNWERARKLWEEGQRRQSSSSISPASPRVSAVPRGSTSGNQNLLISSSSPPVILTGSVNSPTRGANMSNSSSLILTEDVHSLAKNRIINYSLLRTQVV